MFRSEITFPFTKNTKENRARLEEGYGYIVQYYDYALRDTLTSAATWTEDGFKYCHFLGKSPTLYFEKEPNRSYVEGWSKVADGGK